jgi:hypothetical protein
VTNVPALGGDGAVRIAVVGTSGSGKTTMAKLLAAELAAPHIELDALHWEAGWQALTQTNPDEFVRRVASAIAAEAWVLDGNYRVVRALTWGRATHLVWLDYDLSLIIYRVIRRSLAGRRAKRRYGPAIRRLGTACCGRALPFVGPGALGACIDGNSRISSGMTNTPTSWSCGSGGREKQTRWFDS